MNASHAVPDILSSKSQLILNNKVPNSFKTYTNETFEWIWLINADARHLLDIRNREHVLLSMRNNSPILLEAHLKFLKTYMTLPRIDFVLVNKDTDQYVGGMNISLTGHGFEIGKYIGNLDYLGKGIAYPMSKKFIRYINDNVSEIKNIFAVTKIDNAKNINLNFKLGFKIIRRVENDYWLMEIE